jgi:hypothetical protein
MAHQMPWQANKPVRVGNRRDWYFRQQQRRIPVVKHPVRTGLLWKARDKAKARKALGSKRLLWKVMRMVLVYRHRWTGTEMFHRDGKQELGLGACQVHTGEGQPRHGYLVSTVYSLLMRSRHQSRPQDGAWTMLTTIGEACRAVKGELLEQLVDWMVAKLADDHWSIPPIKAVLVQSNIAEFGQIAKVQ